MVSRIPLPDTAMHQLPVSSRAGGLPEAGVIHVQRKAKQQMAKVRIGFSYPLLTSGGAAKL
jgi:hypothetical protein